MEMHAAQIIALLITGLGVGFASGLLGVGGLNYTFPSYAGWVLTLRVRPFPWVCY